MKQRRMQTKHRKGSGRLGARLCMMLVLLALVLLRPVPAFAQSETVQDFAGLLSGAEIAQLEERCATFRQNTGIQAAVLTADSGTVGGYSDSATIRFIENYGDTYLDDTYIALIVNMDARYYYIDVKGNDAFAVYSDRRQEELGDALVGQLLSNDVAGAGMVFLDQAEEQYRYVHATGSFSTVQEGTGSNVPGGFRGGILGMSGLVSAMLAGITTRVRAGRHREKQLATNADRYVVPGTIDMHVNQDRFVSQYVTRAPRVEQQVKPGGGGFTTIHTSGGGHSHSGHGGHF